MHANGPWGAGRPQFLAVDSRDPVVSLRESTVSSCAHDDQHNLNRYHAHLYRPDYKRWELNV